MTTETPDLDKLIAKARATIKPTDSIELVRAFEHVVSALEATKRERDEARATLAKVAEWAKFADKSFSDRVQMPTSNLNSLLALLDAAPTVTTAPGAVTWSCGKCHRKEVLGNDDGQVPEHHRTCPKRQPVCSCPSGDGSLRWPCAVYPPEAGDREALTDEQIEAEAVKRWPGAWTHAALRQGFHDGVRWGEGFHRSSAPTEARHFAPYGSTNAMCDETVPRSAWGTRTDGEYADDRFTVRRDRVTCEECLWRIKREPAEAEPVAWLDRYNVAWVADEWPTEKIAAQYAEKAGPLIPLYRHPAKPIEVTDAMVAAAMNSLSSSYDPPITDISYWSKEYVNDVRSALSAAFAEMGKN